MVIEILYLEIRTAGSYEHCCYFQHLVDITEAVCLSVASATNRLSTGRHSPFRVNSSYVKKAMEVPLLVVCQTSLEASRKINKVLQFLIFIVAPCILISSKSFIYQQMHFISVLENIKIYIKTYIKIAILMF